MILCKYQKTITVKLPIEIVFNFLSDLNNLPLWNKDFTSVQKLDVGLLGASSQFEVKVGKEPATLIQKLRFLHFDKNKRIVYTTQNQKISLKNSFHLSDFKGKTQVTFRANIDSSFNQPKYFLFALEKFFKERNEKHIHRLQKGLHDQKLNSWTDIFKTDFYPHLNPFSHFGVTKNNNQFYLEQCGGKEVVILSDDHHLACSLAEELSKRKAEVKFYGSSHSKSLDIQAACRRNQTAPIEVIESLEDLSFNSLNPVLINLGLDFSQTQKLLQSIDLEKNSKARFIQVSSIDILMERVKQSDLYPPKKALDDIKFKKKNQRALALYFDSNQNEFRKKGIEIISLVPELNKNDHLYKLITKMLPWARMMLDNDQMILESILWAVSDTSLDKSPSRNFFEKQAVPIQKLLPIFDQKIEKAAIKNFLKNATL